MQNEKSRQELKKIIIQHGRKICDDFDSCKCELESACYDSTLENTLLLAVLQQDIVKKLLELESNDVISSDTLTTFANQLHTQLGIDETFALWAVEAWVFALSLDVTEGTLSASTITTTSAEKTVSAMTSEKCFGKFSVYSADEAIVVDKRANLMWLRFAVGQKWQEDTVTGEARKVNWQHAAQLANSFNEVVAQGGFADWRLPTHEELKTLVDEHNGEPQNVIHLGAFPQNVGSWFWSGTVGYENEAYYWAVSFYSGNEDCRHVDNEHCVRLVRSL